MPDNFIYGYSSTYIGSNIIPNFKNELPISTDVDGSIYNNVGFKENMYLSEGNPSSRVDVVTTGFIPIDIEVNAYEFGKIIIYFDNTEISNVSNSRIALYDEDKNYLRTAYGHQAITEDTGVNDTTLIVLDENNIIKSWDISKSVYYCKASSTIGNKVVKYIRICGSGINSESVITINEEISYTITEGGIKSEWINTGHAFIPTDYEERIITLETENDTSEKEIESLKVSISELQNNIKNFETIPNGITNEVSDLLDKSLARNGNSIIRFMISSDAHQNNDDELITKGTRELGQAQGEVLKYISLDFVSSIGDNAWAAYGNTTEEVREQLKQYNRLVKPHIKGEQELNCEGNHDDSCYSLIDNDGDGVAASTEKLSLAETYSLIYAHNKNVMYETDHYIDGYCYKDFEHIKTRVICLNTEQGTSDGGFVEGYQLKWFAETALNMSGKTDWNVITLAHHPLSYGTHTLRDCVNILDSFINGNNFSYTTYDGTIISIDYSMQNCQYVGHFHGHAHAYSVVRMQKYVDGLYVDTSVYNFLI